ncbi:RNA-binding S4 domain-containing protein [Sphaerotilus montanus]|uniref:RNA-binding S4 domain-containing protein n=1 Tax=Sphaerotilus montanus TaxID=522889 RepID=UPI003FA29A7C
MHLIDFDPRGESIPLDALLKAPAAAHSGGAAKTLVADGHVLVDGQPESRKTCKIRAGQVVTVEMAHTRIRVHAPAL